MDGEQICSSVMATQRRINRLFKHDLQRRQEITNNKIIVIITIILVVNYCP